MNKINPKNDETRSVRGNGFQDTDQTNNGHNFTPAKQRLANLRARAAMAGVELCVFPDEDTGETVFIVSRWNLTKQLENIAAAEKWLDMVCGVKK